MQPTASLTTQLLACSWWISEEPSKEARVRGEEPDEWLRDKNQFGVDFMTRGEVLRDQTYVYNPAADATHQGEHGRDEISCFVDLVALPGGPRRPLKSTALALVYATEIEEPFTSDRLRTLSLAVGRAHGCGVVIAGYVHPSGEIFFTQFDVHHHLIKHRKKLVAALGPRSGLNPGEHCTGCPAKTRCPAHVGITKRAVLETPEDAIALYEEVETHAEILRELREMLRGWAADGGGGVELVEKEEELLSKGAFERALGRAGAAKEFERLRAAGVLRKSVRSEVRIVKP
jgi:hypothetical protein